MKGITKKLMSVGLACTLLGGVVGFAGCDEKETNISDTERYYYSIEKDIYLVHYENNTATLHKGDLTVETKKFGYEGYSLTPVLRFNCGKNIPTYLYNPYTTKPDASKYTKVCEKCFEVFE